MREKVDELPKKESDFVSQLPNSYFDRGKEQGQAELVRTMFSNGLTAREIEQATNLSVERIKQLLKK
ncbi:MAG TPA: hypothetical protein VK125_00495 [Bacillota bacterium]|nr:hypothetical protein [Bacillota bacterium]